MAKAIATKEKKNTLHSILEDGMAYQLLLTEYCQESEGEISETLQEWETEFLEKLAQKVDGYAGFLKWLGSEEKRNKELAQEYSKKAQVFKNKSEKMKRHIQGVMVFRGEDYLQGENYKIALEGNGGVLPVEWIGDAIPVNDLPDEICSTVRVLDQDKLRAALESGKEFPFVKFGERGRHVRVR